MIDPPRNTNLALNDVLSAITTVLDIILALEIVAALEVSAAVDSASSSAVHLARSRSSPHYRAREHC